jgi:hypothetical protein
MGVHIAHWAKCNILVRLSNIFEGGFFEYFFNPVLLHTEIGGEIEN